eukprot:251675-Rhodomonas_salina.1
MGWRRRVGGGKRKRFAHGDMAVSKRRRKKGGEARRRAEGLGPERRPREQLRRGGWQLPQADCTPALLSSAHHSTLR